MYRACYWQTFTNELDFNLYRCVIVAAVHFGKESDGCIYMHLNNKSPGSFWAEFDVLAREKGYRNNFHVGLMIGGAGGGWNTLVSNFDECIGLLNEFLKESDLFEFIDIDPESPDTVGFSDVVKFCESVRLPVTASPISFENPMWNKVRSSVSIQNWHLQTYDSSQWSEEYVNSLISSGWPLSKITFGYLPTTFSSQEVRDSAIAEVQSLGIRSVIEWDP